MNQNDIVSILKSTKIPVYYDHAPIGTKLPYIAVQITQPDNFSADDTVYVENFHARVDLYTVGKDSALEKVVKEALNASNIFWTKSEQFIDDDQTFEVEFEFDELGVDVDE